MVFQQRRWIVFLLVILGLISLCHGKRELSPSLSMVYGPGLNLEVVLPVRYFYVQAVDTKGKNYTRSIGNKALTVKIQADRQPRVWKDVLDRNDGSYIVRMRFYETYKNVEISVMYNGKHVAKSPYKLKGLLYHERCDCPENDEQRWLSEMKCPQSYAQISRDLSPFPQIDLTKMKEDAIREFGTHHALCHYSVVHNKVYRKCYGQHVGFSIFMDAWLFSLIRKVKLPDLEFFSNLGDWPLSERKKPPIPILSWCGSDETFDIVMPTYDLTESALEALGRVSLDMLSVQGNTGPKWKGKIEKGFFRGRDSRQERLDLTVMGREKTGLFDVGMTNFFFFEYDEKKYGPKNQHVSFFDFFKYKYQLNIDGTVAAYRFPYLLAGDSVVFKQDSHYYEHFYHDLQSMVHYIPFKRDLSDLEEKIKWAKSHDKEARKIAMAGQTYARDHLMTDQLFCYSFTLFKELSSRYVQRPKVHVEQEHIEMPGEQEGKCQCDRKKKKKKSKKKWKSEMDHTEL
ncbi:protein O-glucosyltransferase 2-like [Clytia hemisphaerica]|uniref:Glycosyl transferase CAP10 domain-containing protein n=1 Tax=Clytia hemisphaerica TaxID=252671 RepID=A0A7M5UL18_9CNID|eukprot:TCONS_00019028-protein